MTDPDTGVVRSFGTPLPSDTFGVFRLPVDSWQDRNGARIDVERSDQGIPVGLRHSGGYYLAVDTRGRRITALRLLDEAPSRYESHVAPSDAGTVVMSYGYDEEGNLTEVINSSGEPLKYAYDDQGRITKWADRNGTWFSYVYDQRGRVVRTAGVDGILSGSLTYDETARTTTYTDSLGRRSTHRYNAEGLVVEKTDPLGHTTRTDWDERGDKPLTITDSLGRTTRYAYAEAGALVELTLPDGSVARAAYNALGQPVEVIDPGGATGRHTYDAAGNLLTTTDPLGAETRCTYDESGHLVAVTDALGHTRTVVANAAGLPLAVTDELGHTTAVRRDAWGRVVQATDPMGHVVRMGWTVEGKPEWHEHADGSRESWTWDGEGNLLTHTDAAGNLTSHTAGPFDVPATRTDPDGTTYAFAYDTELRLTEVTNPQGLTWSYTYDDAGRLVAETDFNGRTLAYAHDAAGGLVARTNGAGEALRFTRDAMGRVTEQQSDTGEVTTYEYDATGELVRAVNADAEVVTRRDALGRELAETVNGRTTAFTYDLLGRRVRRVTPSGLVSEWAYDASGRHVQLCTEHGELGFAYDASGRETERRIGSDVVLSQAWDATDRLTAQTLKSGGVEASRLLQYRAYAYRADGHLAEIRELTSGTRKFDLDAMGRVTGVRAHGWTETYAYDVMGNLSHATAPAHGSAGDREFDGALIRRAGRTTYEHDAQGRLVRKARKLLNGQCRTWTYSWNTEDRLVEAATEGERWHYTYDPLGRRLAKHRVGDGGSMADRTEFSWDEVRLAEQKSPNGRYTTWDYAPDTHCPLTQIEHRPLIREPGESFFAALADEMTDDFATRFHAIVTDAAGAPAELVAPDGTLTWQRRTTAWGTALPAAVDIPDVNCPLRFQGQYADLETGLNYNYFRYYDPEIGRFISADPLGLDPYPNHYAYVPNPYSWIDPFGLACKKLPTDELNWNTKSRPTFGHSFSEHGAGAKNTKSLTDRARSTGNPQGQWLDNDKALDFLKAQHDPDGAVREVAIPKGMGHVIMPNGEIVEANYARLVPKPDGTYKTAFPIAK
ncbi:RHS repeat-associated core domain-containing protein [Streptomyces violascens]|uniref:RHS repeat-associated core domain-containing protein n=1 Tax=Streptomyces violascens TaxID=67381 RepID=UPI0036756F84